MAYREDMSMRPNFVCTVCHQSFTSLEPFKYHLESPEHELAYGIRLKNSAVGSYFCNCCHACVNTLLIWKSHSQGAKHIKVANAFSLAYPSFNFNKPARVLEQGLLDQNVELPVHMLNSRVSNKPHINMKPMDAGAVVIGITEINYDGPGLYTCKLCTDNFNEGNKAQHLLSTRHRANVFKRWDMALYEEAMRVKEVGKTEFADRCNAIASDIFPVEQGVLNKTQKMIYDRIMGLSSEIDYLFFPDRMASAEDQAAGAAHDHYQNRPPPPPANYGPPPRRQYRPPPPAPSYRPPPPTYRPPPPPRAAYERPYLPPRRPYYPPEPEYTEYPETYHQPRYPQPRYRGNTYKPREYPPAPTTPGARPWTPSPSSGEIIVDHDIKCDLAMESARILLQQLNLFMKNSSTSAAVTRVDVLKTQILFDEIVKMSYPLEKDSKLDDDYITVFHNGRLTLKRKEPVRIAPVETNVITDDITDYNGKEVTVLKLPPRKEITELKINRELKDESGTPKEVVKELSVPKERAMSGSLEDKESKSPAKEKEGASSRDKERSSRERERGSSRDKESSSRDSSSRDYRERSSRHGERKSSRSELLSPHGHHMMYPGMPMMHGPQMPPGMIRPGMPGPPGPPGIGPPGMPPQGMPPRRPIFPVQAPSGPPGQPHPQEFQNLPRILDPWGRPVPANMVPRMPFYPGAPPGPPSRGKSPRKRSPSPTPKRNRSSSPRKHSPRKRSPSPPRRSVTKTERPRRSPRRSPAKRAPARSPPRRQRSPARKRSPRRRSPRKRSPDKRSAEEKKEDDEGTLFLEDGAYEELLKSLT